ncbi:MULTISPECIES: 4-(cytidine 5'-diphospho)-2-C-methyl-D-erythritol kinase [Henriciella]|jgi:4-diphosphocytidyl-2-C-methyl-D-erythritol kinase|uniref:4-(cytidine 5'-diphospho)-2-C-methyl-D-erythritol kinase n=1 Tax=Henriciella TaxID=453849 RepID=UPI0035123C95
MLAPAKVNLFLHVDRVKPNGRHDLDSLVVFAGAEAADRLEARRASELSLSLKGPFASLELSSPENLVLRAISACEAKGLTIPPLSLTLHKSIPVAAGLGGGSADAGAMLRTLIQMGTLTAPVALTIARGLGGDVPVSLRSATSYMRGEGERLEPANALPALPAILVNPGVPCPTGAVFNAYDKAGGGDGFRLTDMPDFDTVESISAFLSGETRNDLEAAAINLVPTIGAVLERLHALPGNRLARMSGSGASCFALFSSLREAKAAEKALQASQPHWWVRATLLNGHAQT